MSPVEALGRAYTVSAPRPKPESVGGALRTAPKPAHAPECLLRTGAAAADRVWGPRAVWWDHEQVCAARVYGATCGDERAMTEQSKSNDAGRWWTLAMYPAGGLVLASAWFRPECAALAWIAMVVLTAALVRTRRWWQAWLGIWLADTLTHAVGFAWLAQMNQVALGQDAVTARALAIAGSVCCSMWVALLMGVGHGLAGAVKRRAEVEIPAPLWVPLAWMAGEQISYAFLGLSNDAWLTSQWTVGPVLRMLGHLGWWPAMWACLFVCACVGWALTRRSWRWLVPAALVCAAALCLPPLSDVGREHFKGIAAMRVDDNVTLPHRLPSDEDVELVLWPEDALHLRPLMVEGVTRGAHVRPLLPGNDATHLIGLVTEAPLLGKMNQLVEVAPDGVARQSRAKRHLLLMGERRFAGVGTDTYRPGKQAPVLDVLGRRMAALICGEMLSRELTEEGVEHGGQVLVVAARDHIVVTDQARENMMAVQVLRSVEFGIPSVRASMAGWSYFVSSAGEVLARSGMEHNSFLLWDQERGAREYDFAGEPVGREPPARPAPDVAVLYSREAPRFRTRCPEGSCAYHTLEDFVCPERAAASTVIVAGHGLPPSWLSHSPEQIAAAVRCFGPELLVVDTCLGASAELLQALGEMELRVVAATTMIPAAGFRYAPEFFRASDPEVRAQAVSLRRGALLRWRVDQGELSEALERVAQMPGDEIGPLIVRRKPALAAVPLGGSGEVLVPVDPALATSPLRRKRARGKRKRIR